MKKTWNPTRTSLIPTKEDDRYNFVRCPLLETLVM